MDKLIEKTTSGLQPKEANEMKDGITQDLHGSIDEGLKEENIGSKMQKMMASVKILNSKQVSFNS